MNIYLVERSDKVGWDEFEGFVIIAKNEEEAINIAIKQSKNWEGGPVGVWKKAIFLGIWTGGGNYDDNIILSDFKAG